MAVTTDDRAARLAAIKERAEAATPGPWGFRGNKDAQQITLFRLRAWGDVVMDFRRWGMQSAQPRFVTNGIIRKPQWVMGPDHHPWEIVGIDHPDARFIEHSRSDIDFLLGEVARADTLLDGANKRARIVLDALNVWRERALAAEAQAARLPAAMRVIRRLWRKRSACITSNEAQWRVINEGGARERGLFAALATLVADDFNAWGASSYESYWQCHWCDAEGADINDDPRVRDHKADCPWLLARALVGHAAPTTDEEGNDAE